MNRMIRMDLTYNQNQIADGAIEAIVTALRQRAAIIFKDDGGPLSMADIDVRVHSRGPLDRTSFDLVLIAEVPDNDDQRYAHRRNHAELLGLLENVMPVLVGDSTHKPVIAVQLRLVACDSIMLDPHQRV